jgi:hypothetical protein
METVFESQEREYLHTLDLSFNRITQISGLDTLTKLVDLSLFNNRIEAIEGLDALTGCLQVLSLGNNRLADLEATKVLRRFSKLRAVTLAGNPMAGKDEYRPFVLSHLRTLQFLDYRLVDEAEVVQAESDGTLQEKLQEIRAVEAAHEEARQLERKTAERTALLANAHMAAADGFWVQMEAATAEPNAQVCARAGPRTRRTTARQPASQPASQPTSWALLSPRVRREHARATHRPRRA